MEDNIASLELSATEQQVDATPAGTVTRNEPLAEPAVVNPEDEFSSFSKKSKKSKNKKRDSLVPNVTEDEPSDTVAKEAEATASEPKAIESPAAEDEFESSKRSKKKDKKKRQSTLLDEPTSQSTDVEQPSSAGEPLTPDVMAESPKSEAASEPLGDFELSFNKKKDKKKKGSLLRNEISEPAVEEPSLPQKSEVSGSPESAPVAPPVAKEQQDDFDFTPSSKKSKKKKRGSLLRHEFFPGEDNDTSDVQSPSDNATPATETNESASPAIAAEEPIENLESTSQSVEKDEEQKGGSTFDVIPEQPSQLEPEPEAPNVPIVSEQESSTPALDIQDDEFISTFKKSKKDKKKRRSTQPTIDDGESAETSILMPEPTNATDAETERDPAVVPEEPKPEEQMTPSQPAPAVEDAPEDLFGDFAFSKKDKKKNKKNKKGSVNIDSEDSGSSIPVEPMIDPKTVDEPEKPSFENSTIMEKATEIQENSPAATPDAEPVTINPDPAKEPMDDDWDAIPSKKSKRDKKKRKDSSKLDSEEVSLPSEPTLEPSKDDPLTPLPVDQVAEDNASHAPIQEPSVDPQVASGVAEEPADERNVSSTKSKKDKKKGSSKSDLETPTETSAPVEPVVESNQPLQITSSDEIVPDKNISKPPQAAENLEPTGSQDIQGSVEEEWDSFLTKEPKGKKNKNSGTATPDDVRLVLEDAAPATSASPNEPEVEWASSSIKESKKGTTGKNSDTSTPIDEISLAVEQDPGGAVLPVETPAPTLEKDDHVVKETKDEPLAAKETVDIYSTGDEKGPVPVQESKEDTKKRDFDAPPAEDTLISTLELDQSLSPDSLKSKRPPTDEQPVVPTETTGAPEEQSGLEEKSREVDQPVVLSENALPVDPPADAQVKEASQDQANDEWGAGSVATSKKKDKKKKKAGLSSAAIEAVVAEAVPDQASAGSEHPLFLAESIVKTPHQAREQLPSEDLKEANANQGGTWEALPGKQSNKDKKNRKSGLWTPIEETLPSVPEQPASESIKQELPTASDVLSQEAVRKSGEAQGEGDFFSMKSSKKDKKKKKSGLSTPIEETLPSVPEPPVSTISEQKSPAADIPSQEGVKVQDEDEFFPIKSSKKDKKKNRRSGLSTPAEEALPFIEEILPDISEQQSPEPVEQELLAADPPKQETDEASSKALEQEELFSFKPSKKDKKNRGSELSTPAEDTLPLLEPKTASSALLSQAEPVQAEGEIAGKDQDEEEQFSVKLSKKDKKKSRKSGISTPVVESPPATEPATASNESAVQVDPASIAAEPNQGQSKDSIEQDEWSALSFKKGKKKNRKSGLSTPIQEPLPLTEPEVASLEPAIQANITIEDSELPTQASNVKSEADDVSSFSVKQNKGKKDKKRSSGSSTPIEPSLSTISDQQFLEPEKPSSSEVSSSKIDARAAPLDRDIDVTLMSIDEPVDERAPISEKSKEEERKFGLSTPFGKAADLEFIAPPMKDSPASIDEPNKPKAEIKENILAQPDEAVSQQPTINDLGLPIEKQHDEAVATASKKDKNEKGKNASPESSEDGPSSSSPIAFISTEAAAGLLESDRVVTEPASLVENTEQDGPVPAFFSKKLAKKDKRKRQSPVDAPPETEFPAEAPLTTWAHDVEEAGVERDVPVIQEIADDQSLAHIEPAVESTPADNDFIRPQKKGKKGSKRSSGSSASTPAKGSSPESKDTTSSAAIAGLATIGASVAGAALLGRSTPSREEASPSTPTKKSSKKDKKKESIDHRAPREDNLFDDPALWEGANPKVHEEAKEGNDDSDGFWSPLQQDEELNPEQPSLDVPAGAPDTVASGVVGDEQDLPNQEEQQQLPVETARPLPSNEAAQPAQPSRAVPIPTQSEASQIPDIFGVKEKHELPRQEPRTPTDESTVSSSQKKKGKEKEKEKDNRVNSAASTSDATSKPQPLIVEPEVDRDISLDKSPIRQESNFTSPRDRNKSQHDSGAISTEAPSESVSPRLKSRLRHRLSDLPIVHEENSTRLDTGLHPNQNPHDAGANRDSAFVTESPVPAQREYGDVHEHVRDSGVHLRDETPVENVPEPVKSSDEALARLAWPAVDEATETVDLHRSQRPQPEKHRAQEEASARGHDSKRTKSDTASDFHQDQRSTPAKLHNDRDLLPSQKNREQTHTDLHRTPTIHGGRKAEGQSMVKQRLQRFESPELVSTPNPKAIDIAPSRSSGQSRSERARQGPYPELGSSPRPKAERPKGTSEIEAGAVIAGATLGFAAARKLSQEKRPDSAQSQRSTTSNSIKRLRTPDPKRPDSATSHRSGTPPLRRSDKKSGDLRFLSQQSKLDLAKEAELATLTTPTPSSVTAANPTANEGRVRAKDMADVYVSDN